MAADDKTPPGSKASSGSKSGGDSSGVMRVIRKVGGPVNWPLLTRTNYTERALLMNVKMKAWNLWDAVEFGGTGTQEEMLALDTITSAVPMEMVAQLAVKETAKEAWDAVATIHVRSDQVCKAKAQRLRREYEMIRFGPDEAIDDFITHLSNLVATMGTVGETVEPSKVVWKFLRITPKKVREVAVAIEISLHISLTPITSIIYTLVILLMVNQSTVFPSHASLKYIGINSLLNQRSNICPKQTASH